MLGNRTSRPKCNGKAPEWVRELIANPMDSAAILACVESEGDTAVLRIKNNRAAWVAMRSTQRFQWASVNFPGVNDWAPTSSPSTHSLPGAKDFVLVPPLTEAAIGITRPQFGHMDISGKVTAGSAALAAAWELATAAGTNQKVQNAYIRLFFACSGTVAQPASDVSVESASWLTSISDCVANTASDQHMFNEVLAGTLNEDEVVALKGLQKAVKYLTIAKWVAMGLDLYADWGGGGGPTVVAIRGRVDAIPEPPAGPASAPSGCSVAY